MRNRNGGPASEKVPHPNLRWHFYIALKDWKPSGTEDLSSSNKITTAPLTCLAPGLHCNYLRQKFTDPRTLVSAS